MFLNQESNQESTRQEFANLNRIRSKSGVNYLALNKRRWLLQALRIPIRVLVREEIILFVFFSSEHECERSQSAVTCFVCMRILYSDKSRTKILW